MILVGFVPLFPTAFKVVHSTFISLHKQFISFGSLFSFDGGSYSSFDFRQLLSKSLGIWKSGYIVLGWKENIPRLPSEEFNPHLYKLNFANVASLRPA